MIEIPKNKPEKSAMKILRLIHENPGAGLQELLQLTGFSASNLGRITQNLRGSGNLCSFRIEVEKTKRGYYQLTAKGEAVLGISKPLRAPIASLHYTTLEAIEMVSYRPGAWEAQGIAARGLRC